MTEKHAGLPVSGYREQPQLTIDVVNRNKANEERQLRLLEIDAKAGDCDGRWLAIAKTHLEQAFMAWNRAIFKPGRAELPEDAKIENGPGADVVEAARRCHEANRAICATFGHAAQKPWEEAEPWQRESAIKGVLFALANPDASPEQQHEAWAADKRANGWRYGETKDAEAKTHPCLVPYAELPADQRVKDGVFRAIVSTMTARAA